MFLLIDNSVFPEIKLYLYDGQNWEKKTYKANRRDNPLLKFVDGFLEVSKLSIKDIEGMAVVVGRGSFTSTRIATTLANTLIFALKIPAVAVNEVNLERLAKIFSNKKFKNNKNYLSATYSGKPNINIKTQEH